MWSLGVVGDNRPLPGLQPPLPEGIHLRWAFKRDPSPQLDQGFPWYGFYLFRRQSLGSSNPTCTSTLLGTQVPGTIGPTLTLSLGTFSSDQNLHLTDEFAPSGTVELDLSGRTFVKFQMNPATPMREAKVTIAFAADFPPPGGGTGGGPGSGGPPGGGGPAGGLGGAPGTSAESCACGCGRAAVLPVLTKVVRLGAGAFRATFGYTNTSTAFVSVPVGRDNRFSPAPAGRGQPTLFAAGRQSGAFTVDFDGRPITWTLSGISVTASAADAPVGGGGGDPSPGTSGGSGAADGIVVTALRYGFVVDERVVSGRTGDVVTVPLASEAIDAVLLTAGPARLIDICATPATDGIGQGWAPVPHFPDPNRPQPMCLPVSDPAYPCNPGSNDEATAKQLAFRRIRYGTVNDNGGVLSAPEWDGTIFTDFHETLIEIVSGGPNNPLGITDVKKTMDANSDSSDPAAVRPTLTQSSLDVLLNASINPAAAQMLGLYWVDDDALENVSYDYLLVADNTGAGGLNAQTILGLVAAQNFANIDAYLLIGARREATPPLAPPGHPKAYALPVKAIPPGFPGDAAGLVGVRWDIPAATTGESKIRPDTSILFHVWRKDFGRATPSGPAAPETYQKITESSVAPVRSFDPSQVISGWPTFALYYVDGPLAEGWYGYRASGIDIFGRYSARSEPAVWRSTDDASVQDDSAVHLLDTTPPPPPTQVKAWVLDPQDPTVIKDAAYDPWRKAHPTAIGLRVRWAWPRRLMLRAPDTKEFRIYIQPGSFMTGPGDALNWSQRVAIVGFEEQIVIDDRVAVKNLAGATLSGQNATVAIDAAGVVRVTLAGMPALQDGFVADGLELELTTAAGGTSRFPVGALDLPTGVAVIDRDPKLTGPSGWTLFRERTYEVLLPGAALAVPAAGTVPLPTTPSLTVPVGYGLVGVSAADDKADDQSGDVDRHDRRRDMPNPGPFVPRPGNEGAVGGPAVVYQVWRTLPGAPAAPYAEQSLKATRADFKSHSFFLVHFEKQANLSTDVFRALDETLFLADAKNTKRVAEASAISATMLGWFTSANAPDSARLTAALNQVKATPPLDYGKLTDDALRLIASLPSNVSAFSRITNPPLRPDVAENDDRVGPNENPPPYTPQSNRGSFLDTLDGRATNRYFYRTAHVDDAHNQGPMGVSTPPVYLPVTSLPATPSVTGIDAADRQITVRWRGVLDAGISRYRVYRASTRAAADDLRSMDVAGEVAPPGGTGGDPVPATGELDLVDTKVIPLQPYYYRVTAIRAATAAVGETESRPSPVSTGRAFRSGVPDAPVMEPPVLDPTAVPPSVLLSWTTAEPLQVLVQRRVAGESAWRTVTDWSSSATSTFSDHGVLAGTAYDYRVRGRDLAAIVSGYSDIVSIAVP